MTAKYSHQIKLDEPINNYLSQHIQPFSHSDSNSTKKAFQTCDLMIFTFPPDLKISKLNNLEFDIPDKPYIGKKISKNFFFVDKFFFKVKKWLV